MASHRGAAALLLIIASLVVAVALNGADARSTVRPDKTAALLGADMRLTPRLDAHGPGNVGAAAPAVAKPECENDGNDDDDDNEDDSTEPVVHHHHHEHVHHHYYDGEQQPGEGTEFHQPGEDPEAPMADPTVLETESEEPKQELCSTCEPEPKPEPSCDSCEPKPKPEPEMTCNKVHAVKEGETCYSVGQCAGLGQDDFLRFNPNICCDHLFVGQWVCLDATCAA